MGLFGGGNLYEKLVGGVLGAGGAPALPPARPSAAVVPWRRGPDGVEVYWVRRADALPFMGGWHAFPGGGLSRSDAALPVAGRPRGLAPGTVAAAPPEAVADGREPEPDLVPGIVACALRELFEETGLLLAAGVPPGADLEAARRALLGGEAKLDRLLADWGATLDAAPLTYAGRWLTPPFAPARFDNRFFLLEWPEDRPAQPRVVPGELAAGEWIPARRGRELWLSGEVLAAPPILHFSTVLAEDGPEAGLPRLVDPGETNLGPFRRVELRPGIVMFPLATATLPPAATTNAYLLGHREAVLVDPGSPVPAEVDRLERALAAARERSGLAVAAIWLTHHHPDHVGGVPELRRRLGVPVWAHRATAERLAARGIAVDRELTDGERLELAGDPPQRWTAVHTPGHARGHLCFFEESQRSLLAGDMVAGLGTIVVDPPEGDMDDYLASLEKLLALRPSTLFPGHGPAVRDAAGKLREYRDHRLWREERVLAAWNEGLRKPAKMVPVVYDDAPEAARRLAERQVVAHLERLRRAGRID